MDVNVYVSALNAERLEYLRARNAIPRGRLSQAVAKAIEELYDEQLERDRVEALANHAV
jgi:hypothetical protein